VTGEEATQERAIGRVVFVVFLVAPLTVWLAAPPLLQQATADRVCREIVTSARAEWTRTPLPHWRCMTGSIVVEDLGWWA
jgi:hypothetical protein